MRNLAKHLSVRTLTLQFIFVAIVAMSIAGLSWESPLLKWSALVATLILVVADPLTSDQKAGATPTAEGVEDSAIKRAIFDPSKTAPSTSASSTLIASKV
jgi:hypothetical protein